MIMQLEEYESAQERFFGEEKASWEGIRATNLRQCLTMLKAS